VGNPFFYLSNRGASLKPPLPKPSLGKKDQVRKKSTPGVTSIDYNTHSAEVELEVGYFPCVGDLFPRQLFQAISSSSRIFSYVVWAVPIGGELAILLSSTAGHSPY